MAETVNQDTNTTTEQNGTAGTENKTFTQAELNAIISDRINREREKFAGYDEYKAKAEKYDAAEEAAKTDLQKAQDDAARYKKQWEDSQAEISARNAREKVAAAKGVPAHLLTGSTEEDCDKQADELLKWHGGRQKYTAAADGGEANAHASGYGGKTRDQFADWFAEAMK